MSNRRRKDNYWKLWQCSRANLGPLCAIFLFICTSSVFSLVYPIIIARIQINRQKVLLSLYTYHVSSLLITVRTWTEIKNKPLSVISIYRQIIPEFQYCLPPGILNILSRAQNFISCHNHSTSSLFFTDTYLLLMFVFSLGIWNILNTSSSQWLLFLNTVKKWVILHFIKYLYVCVSQYVYQVGTAWDWKTTVQCI